MQKEIPIKMVIGPLLFSVSVYAAWTFGRLFFCGVEF